MDSSSRPDVSKESEKRPLSTVPSQEDVFNDASKCSSTRCSTETLSTRTLSPCPDNCKGGSDANIFGSKAVVFSLKNQVGGLVRALRIFQEMGVDVQHIESRKSKRNDSEYEIFVDIDCDDQAMMSDLVHHLRHEVDGRTLEEFERSKSSSPKDKTPAGSVGGATESAKPRRNLLLQQPSMDNDLLLEGLPWFPKRVADLDQSSNRVLMYGSELDADHPGFKDHVYRERRKYFNELASSYRYGEAIKRAEYTLEETQTWGVVFNRLSQLYKEHAVKEFNDNFVLLIKYCGYREDNIPQLEDVSQFLKSKFLKMLESLTVTEHLILRPNRLHSKTSVRILVCTRFLGRIGLQGLPLHSIHSTLE